MSDDILEHHGVKGMKWGVRKRRDGDSGGRSSRRSSKKSGDDSDARPSKRATRKASRAARDAAIKDARKKLGEKDDAYEKATLDYLNASSDKGRKTAEKVMTKAYQELNNKDLQKTAAQRTGKEKVVNAASIAVYGATTLSAIAMATGAKRKLG